MCVYIHIYIYIYICFFVKGIASNYYLTAGEVETAPSFCIEKLLILLFHIVIILLD